MLFCCLSTVWRIQIFRFRIHFIPCHAMPSHTIPFIFISVKHSPPNDAFSFQIIKIRDRVNSHFHILLLWVLMLIILAFRIHMHRNYRWNMMELKAFWLKGFNTFCIISKKCWKAGILSCPIITNTCKQAKNNKLKEIHNNNSTNIYVLFQLKMQTSKLIHRLWFLSTFVCTA